jgi:hypothetical protein
MESIYAFIIVLSLATLSILVALIVKELKNLNALLKEVLGTVLKNRLADLAAIREGKH